MFSNNHIASFVNQHFEPVWQAVRPVPIVRIDFGNGHVLTRTLHGNVATYVCTAEGQALDILPGLYEPNTFLDSLQQFWRLAKWVDLPRNKGRRETFLAYHETQAQAARKGSAPPRIRDMADRAKTFIERGVKLTFVPGDRGISLGSDSVAAENIHSPDDLASWKALAEDTELNQSIRRCMIHEHLLKTGLIQPEDVTKWLYAEVLHANLDDPYLGLGKFLFANYPFGDDDAR